MAICLSVGEAFTVDATNLVFVRASVTSLIIVLKIMLD